MRFGVTPRRADLVGVTLATALVVMLLGAGILLRENLHRQDQRFRADLRLEVFLRDDTTSDELRRLINELQSLTGFASLEHRDKVEAYARMQDVLGTQLLPSGGFNPFPSSLIVMFKPAAATFQTFQNAENQLKNVRYVEGTRYPKAALMSQDNVFSFFNRASILLLFALAISLLLVMWLGMRRVALISREESRILRLLGADWRQIGLPLAGRGLAVGAAAAVVGLLLLYVLWDFSARLSLQLSFITGYGVAVVAVCSVAAGVISASITAWGQLR